MSWKLSWNLNRNLSLRSQVHHLVQLFHNHISTNSTENFPQIEIWPHGKTHIFMVNTIEKIAVFSHFDDKYAITGHISGTCHISEICPVTGHISKTAHFVFYRAHFSALENTNFVENKLFQIACRICKCEHKSREE